MEARLVAFLATATVWVGLVAWMAARDWWR